MKESHLTANPMKLGMSSDLTFDIFDHLAAEFTFWTELQEKGNLTLGQPMVSSWDIPKRRKFVGELTLEGNLKNFVTDEILNSGGNALNQENNQEVEME